METPYQPQNMQNLLSAMLVPDTQALLHHTLNMAAVEPIMLATFSTAKDACIFKGNAAALDILALSDEDLSALRTVEDFLSLFISSGEVSFLRRCMAENRRGVATVDFFKNRKCHSAVKIEVVPLNTEKLAFALVMAPLRSRSLAGFLHGLDPADQRMLLSMTTDHFWEADAQLRVTFFTGSRPDGVAFDAAQSALGRRPWEFPFTDIGSADFDVLRRAHQAQQAFRNFEYAICLQGQRLWLSVSGYPFFDVQGALMGYRGTNTDISQRKKAEQALRQADEQFRLLADNTHDGLAIMEGGQVVFASSSYLQTLGYSMFEEFARSESDIVGLIHPQDREAITTRIYQAIADQRPNLAYRLRLMHKNGHYVWREDSARFTYDAHGKMLRCYVVARDVTEQIHTEDRLARITSMLAQTERLTHTGGWSLDSVNGKLNWSDEVYAIHELDQHTALTFDLAMGFYTPDSQQQLRLAVETALQNGAAYNLVLELRTAKGHERWIRTLGQALEQDGVIVGIFGSIQDITNEVVQQRQDLEQQDLLRLCFDRLPLGILILSGDDILYANPSLRCMTGYASDHDIGLFRRQLPIARSDDFSNSLLMPLQRKDQSLMKCLVSASEILWQGQRKQLFALSPMSESDMLEIEVKATQQRFDQMLLSQIEQQQTHIAHEIHDSLGSILVGISLMLKSMQQRCEPPLDDLGHVLHHLQHAMDICRTLARGMLPVDDAPGACWRGLERLCQDVESLSQVRCRFNKRGGVDAISQQSGNHVYRMTQEALTNVLRHANASRISVTLTACKKLYTLSINDNGIGLPGAGSNSPAPGGIGLKSLQARCKLIGAKLTLGSGGLGGALIKVCWREAESTSAQAPQKRRRE